MFAIVYFKRVYNLEIIIINMTTQHMLWIKNLHSSVTKALIAIFPLQTYLLYSLYHVEIWQVLLQLMCYDTNKYERNIKLVTTV